MLVNDNNTFSCSVTIAAIIIIISIKNALLLAYNISSFFSLCFCMGTQLANNASSYKKWTQNENDEIQA